MSTIRFNIILPSAPRTCQVASFILVFPNKILRAFVSSPMHATFPAHRILLDLMTRILFGTDYRLLSPHYAVFSSLLLLHLELK